MSDSPDDLVRLEYTGNNRGPIPYRGVSGTVYRASSKTYRFVDAFPEDVNVLVGTGKFVVVQRKTDSNAVEIDGMVENTPDDAKSSEKELTAFGGHIVLDMTTIETLKNSLLQPVELSDIELALETEQEKSKPRSTVISILEAAIENHPDNLSSL